MSYFADFVSGFELGERIKTRQRDQLWNDEVRSRQRTLWDRQDQEYKDAEDLKKAEEMTRRLETILRRDDGSYRTPADLQREGLGKDFLEWTNDPYFASVRNVNGKDVKIVGAYGIDNDRIALEAEWRDPKTGEVSSRGGLTVGRTNEKTDPVRELSLQELYKRTVGMLRAKSAAFNEKYMKQQELGSARADDATIARYAATGGQDAPNGAAPSAPSGSPTPKWNGSQDDYFRLAYNSALKANGGNHEAALTAAAQSALESGWGAHAPGNNYFGIKGPGQELQTTEVDPYGNPYGTKSSFRTYGSMEESFGDRERFLSENPRYAKAGYNPATQTAEEQAAALQRAGYATDPAYADKLTKIIARGRELVGSAPQATAQAAPQVAPQVTPDREAAVMRRGNLEALRAEREAAAAAAAPQPVPTIPNTRANRDAVQEYAGAALEMQRAGNVVGGNYAQRARERLAAAAKALPDDVRAQIDADPAAALRNIETFTNKSGIPQTVQNPQAVERLKALDAEIAALVKEMPPDTPQQAQQDAGIIKTAVEQATASPTPAIRVPKEVMEALVRDYARNPTKEKLETIERVRETGRLFKRDIKIFGSATGGVTVVDENGKVVSQTVSEYEQGMREARLAAARDKQLEQIPGTPQYEEAALKRQKLRHEVGASKYLEDSIEAASKANQFWWSATGEKGKHNESEVKDDILQTLHNERDTLRSLGFPDDVRNWTTNQADAFLELWRASRRNDHVEKGWISDQKTDTRGTLNKTLIRDLGPKSPKMTVQGKEVDLNKVVAFVKQNYGKDISLEEAAQLVQKYYGGGSGG